MILKELHDQVMALPRELRKGLANRLSLDWSQAEVADEGAEWLFDEAAEARQLLDKLMALTVAERTEFVAAIDESLLSEDDWEKECIAIVEARLERYDQGLDQAIPWEAVLAEMRQR